jgi:hypothetical protein
MRRLKLQRAINTIVVVTCLNVFGKDAALARDSPATSPATMKSDAFIKKWDLSGKGLLSLGAIDNAAIVKFESLDANHTGRLTVQVLTGVLTQREFDVANPDRDATIGVDEWLDLVKHRFSRANIDHDGTLDARELAAPDGQELLKLVG